MKENRRYIQFILIAIFSYLVWFLTYELWLKADGRLDAWLTNSLSINSSFVLRALGYEAGYFIRPQASSITLNGKHFIGIAHVCNGLVLYALFFGFLLSFPGRLVHKLWFIPVGILAIYLMNILRAVALFMVKVKDATWLDFSHRYTFTVLMYGFIFGLWMLWINRYSGLSLSQTREKTYHST